MRNLRIGNKQDGAVFAIAIIFLLLLTMLGITAMQVTTMEERMAGNSRDRSLAFQSAEIGLHAGEKLVKGKDFYEFNSSCTGALCAEKSAPSWKTYAWDGSKDVQGTGLVDGVAEQPRYFTEYVGQVKCPECTGGWRSAYGITTRAKGANTNTTVHLNQTYRP